MTAENKESRPYSKLEAVAEAHEERDHDEGRYCM